MQAVLMLVIALVPLVIAPGFSFYFDITPKVVIVLLGVAVALSLGIRNLHMLFRTRAGRLLLVLLALEFLSLAVSTAASINPGLSLTGSNWRRFGLVTHGAVLIFAALAAAWVAGNAQRAQGLLVAICVTGIPIAIYGILQYFGWDPWLPKEGYHAGEGVWTIVRPPGTLGYAAYFANYLLFVVFAGFGLRWKWLGGVAAAMGSMAIMLSGTRAAIFGLIAGVLLLRPRWSKLSAGIAAAAVASAALFYFSPSGVQLRARTRWYLEDPRGGSRLMLWRDSARMGIHHWLLGSGPETFSSEFPQFESADLARAYPNFYHESPHNMFLDAWTSQGFVGLAVLVALCAAGFRAASVRPLTAGLAAVIVAQQFTVFILPTALIFYVWIAMMIVRAETPAPAVEPYSHRSRAGLSALSATVSLALVFFSIRVAVADRLLAETNDAIRARDSARAVLLYQKARRWSPPGMNADLWFSRAAISLAPARAFEAAVRAVGASEDPQNASYNAAIFHAAANDSTGMEEKLRAAIACAPNWYKPHWALARLLQSTGRTRDAGREAAVAADLNGAKNPEVMQTLRELMKPKEE